MGTKVKDMPLPEMVFGSNRLTMYHAPSGVVLEMSALPALRIVSETKGCPFQVANAKQWTSSNENRLKDVAPMNEDWDWTYTTTYDHQETRQPRRSAPSSLLSRRSSLSRL